MMDDPTASPSGNLLSPFGSNPSADAPGFAASRVDQACGARPYSPREYVAFKAEDIGSGRSRWLTNPIPLVRGPRDLDEAVNEAVLACFHRQVLVVREASDEAVRLHLFVIRKAAPKWVHPAGEIMPRRVEDLYAQPLCVLDGDVLGVLP